MYSIYIYGDTTVWRDNVVDQLIPSALLEVEMHFSDGSESQDVLNVLSFSPIYVSYVGMGESKVLSVGDVPYHKEH